MAEISKAFFFEERAAGEFEEYPAGPGVYDYMPFRSFGHLRIVEERKEGRFPRCCYFEGDFETSFDVVEILNPRRLRLSAFKKAEKRKPNSLEKTLE